MDENSLNLISDRILTWYAQHHRDLPWRHTRNPYSIWVSEVMLQQTQVDTVIPYYHRFLSKFPTIEALAKAPLQEVLKAWENMGYYARARHLHAAAREVMTQMGGEIPRIRDQLICLPGVGSYTAAAILCLAFGKRIPTVDGNVRRVLSRLFSIKEPIDQSQTQRRIYELADALIPPQNPAHFNQGIMEIGATICKPRKPLCRLCPLDDYCLAFQRGLEATLPITKKRKPLPHRQMTAAIIWDNLGRLLIIQRPNHGLLGGLWKFPGGMKAPGEELVETVRRTVHEELGIWIEVKEAAAVVKHAYTHFRITLHAFQCAWRSGKLRALGCTHWRWVESKGLANFPFSRADRKVISAFLLR